MTVKTIASQRLQLTAILALVVISATTLSSEASPEQQTRTIPRSQVTRIPELLRPDDKLVIIQDMASKSGMDDEPVSLQKELAWLADSSSAIAVVEVTEVSGSLTDDKMWVQSRIAARIVDSVTLRQMGRIAALPDLNKGRSVEFEWKHGGDVVVGSVLVRAHPSQLEKGQRYLVCINGMSQAGAFHLGPRFRVEPNGTLHHLVEPNDPRRFAKSPIDGLKLDDIVRQLRIAAGVR